MLICKVVKPLVSTNRIPDFEHKHLQVVLDGSTQKVAVDAVGCIPGDWVICVGSSAAREAAGACGCCAEQGGAYQNCFMKLEHS